MEKVYYKILTISLILILNASMLIAQYIPGKERGEARERAQVQMEGNRVRATIFNFGHTGRTGAATIDVMTPYEWPKNTGKVYLAQTAVWMGAEVTDNNGEIQKIVIVNNGRTSPQGKSWNLEPVAGYHNPSQIVDPPEVATSVNPDTWPSFWPDRMNDETDPGWAGTWNGYFGKNVFNADQEVFYRASDDNYDKYGNYFPDSTDLNRKGLGFIIDVRALSWSQVLVEDVIYILHYIKNDGTQDMTKVAFTLWFADFVGGDGDSMDDISDFDLIEDIVWARDSDHRAINFGSDPVGIVAVTLLETPGNAVDRIDNDGDSDDNGPLTSEAMLTGEISDNLVDDNGNGLIDENQTHIPFGNQKGVSYADFIDNDGDAETGAPVVTQEMVDQSQFDTWMRWPLMDAVQAGKVHLIMLSSEDLGFAFKDYIDNDDDGENSGSPTVTQEMINTAASDAPYYRYKVPGTDIILYDVKAEDLGKKYADGIYNNNDGAIDENMDEGIDEMVDERRDNGIDDDGDWNPFTDDVGLDGVAETNDPGELDGYPTSGARYGLPGEPNVDVTDVSETDQIGVTNATKIAAGATPNNDAQIWFDIMMPGKFFDPITGNQQGEYDIFVSSSFFPLQPGQVEPMSLAVILGNAPVPDPSGDLRKAEILRKRVRAQETYNNDYQFANAPLTPTLKAIAGDNKVTLYWDEIAESSFDRYIDNIGGIGEDFEGYKIYRSTDAAFQDIEDITTGYGVPKFKTALAIFDLADGIEGFDPLGIEGAHFYMGTDSGLQHTFVDTTAKNGFTYYYALTSFDFGYIGGNIIPSECPIRISLKSDGSAKLGQNVVRITPDAPAAGYNAPSLGEIKRVEGTTTGTIAYNILDIDLIKDGHVYYVTFEDTLKAASSSSEKDTLTTKNFTLTDSTEARVLIEKSTRLSASVEQPIIDGFQLVLLNEERVQINEELSGWSDETLPAFVFEKFVVGNVEGEERPNDYEITFGDVGMATSTEVKIGTNTLPSKQVNFKVRNKSTNNDIDFAFLERDLTGGDGVFSAKGTSLDRIIFMENNNQGEKVYTWWFYLPNKADEAPGYRLLTNGDVATIVLRKPFLKEDKFRFVAQKGYIDGEAAKLELDRIKVVPNPYVASAKWEPKNPFVSGRGPRSIHFTHLPAECTIRIFTVNGELVKTINHSNALNDGSAEWNLLTDENLSIAYGVYIYHVDAPGIGEITGKFAVIK
ncbi:MAG: hypothetical protein V1720_11055 [bacterium]